MSVLNQSGEEQVECPLCMEPLEVDDLHFYPCTCGYQICRFCWNRIREGENGLCPACRKAYPENPADFTPLSQEQVAAIKTEKKAREAKRRNKTLESRRALANVRVVQNNLVFVVGLPVRLADPEILKRQEYFGKYGKIHKVVINQSTTYAGSQGPSASAYVTYVSSADALRAIQGVNNVTLDGRVLKGSLGTTKYCANFMKNQPCPKPDCMYLHELGDPKASFTKEEMHAGLHQVYERKLHNQLLQSQREKPEEKQNGSGNSSASAEKSSSKDGNPSNFIPTTVVTSSHINVVNSSKSNKKESMNGVSSSSAGSGGSAGSSGSNGSVGKEAWPSLGASPPADSPARLPPSPKPHHEQDCVCPYHRKKPRGKRVKRYSHFKSQENGTSESSSPTQQVQQAQTKQSKDTHTDSKTNRSKEPSTNGQSKKSKTDSKSKQKPSNNSINNDSQIDNKPAYSSPPQSASVFDNESQNYLSNDIDELESDRHSLLENHDLLDNSDHSLLDDDTTHSLLGTASNDVLMMQRHNEMLAGLVDTNHLLPQMKSPMLNGYGLSESISYLGNDRQISQMNQGLMEQKELLLRERTQSEMLMRQNEMLARQHNVMQHNVEPKHYMSSSIGLESASELLGANFHQNPNMLPPFGMRVDAGMGSMGVNNMGGNMAGVNMGVNSFLLHNQQLLQQQQQMQQTCLHNGYDTQQSANEVRYLAENMDKFFTDFHKAQQMRLLRGADERRASPTHHYPHNMLSAERLEMEHKQRMSNVRGSEGAGGRAAGDGDDDLDFDPFKETQKAFAELMETEMMQNTVSSGDNMERVRRSRLAPPGFSHMNTFVRQQTQHHQPTSQYNNYGTSHSAAYSDWTAMDPAIMSTSVKPPEVFARLAQPGVKLGAWWAPQPLGVPLPPGFAPPKPTQRAPECIDAK